MGSNSFQFFEKVQTTLNSFVDPSPLFFRRALGNLMVPKHPAMNWSKVERLKKPRPYKRSLGTIVVLSSLLSNPPYQSSRKWANGCVFQRVVFLCVDDNPDSRDLVRFMLQEDGYDVTCLESGREALALVENEVLIF